MKMKVDEVARRLEVSRSLVYRLCSEGRLPHARVGFGRGAIRISEEDLKTFLESCRANLSASGKGEDRGVV